MSLNFLTEKSRFMINLSQNTQHMMHDSNSDNGDEFLRSNELRLA